MLSDDLRVHEFHLLDVDWNFGIPPFVLFPSVGFTSITMPEMTVETESIREGTDNFMHHVLTKASTNTITLTKGVTPFNSDFWRWTVACLKGTPTDPSANLLSYLADLGKMVLFQGAPDIPGKRRNLILLHATGISPAGLVQSMESGKPDDLFKGAGLFPAAGVTAIAEGLSTLTQGMIDVGITSIPGKVYMLFDCMPTRYKPGSDFDANTTAVSIEELDIAYHHFEEFSLTG
jgi:phage tail-like protein